MLLANNLGLSFSTHYCHGIAVKSALSFGHKSLDCGMAKLKGGCANSSNSELSILEVGCCENKFTDFSISDGLKTPALINLNVVHACCEVAYLIIETFYDSSVSRNELGYYSPPLNILDFSILHQVFLI